MIRMPASAPRPLPEPEATPPEVKQYQRQKLMVSVCSIILTVAFLLVAALSAGPKINEWVEQVIGANRWARLAALAFVYVACLEILSLPLDFWSGYVLEHRYQLSNQTLAGWVWRKVKAYLVGAPIGLALLFGLYTLLWFSGSWWWLWAAVGWLAVSVVLGQLMPVVILPLFYRVTRLDNQALLERLQRLAAGTGLSFEGIYRLDLSAE